MLHISHLYGIVYFHLAGGEVNLLSFLPKDTAFHLPSQRTGPINPLIDPIHAAAMMNKKRGLAGKFTANLCVSL